MSESKAPYGEPIALTREEQLFIASRLLSRARHESKKLLNAERHAKTLHPELLKQINEDIAECTRLAVMLQTGASLRTAAQSVVTSTDQIEGAHE